MKRRCLRRTMAAACALGLFLAAASCLIYPSAWSPDSKRVVLPIPVEETMSLAMTDLNGKLIRNVATVGAGGGALSAAAWSPDGKWIAYMRFQRRPPAPPGDETPGSLLGLLMLQQAESGQEKEIWRCVFVSSDDPAAFSNAISGPHWLSNSQGLIVRSRSKDGYALSLLDLEGKTTLAVPFTTEPNMVSLAPSPDGKVLAFANEFREEDIRYWNIHVADAAKMAAGDRRLGEPLVAIRAWQPVGIAWKPDGSAFYVASTDVVAEGKIAVVVRRVSPEKPGAEVVWRKEGARLATMGVSSGTGHLVMQYELMDVDVTEWLCIDVLDPASGKSTMVTCTYEIGNPMSGAGISPDGKWVSFCATTGERAFLGVIASRDGADLRYYVPKPELKGAVAKVVRQRLDTALEIAGWPKQLEAATGAIEELKLVEGARKAAALFDSVASKADSAMGREAVAYAKVAYCLKIVAALPPEERAQFAPDAEKRLREFLAAYPNHVLGPELHQEMDQLLKPAAAPGG